MNLLQEDSICELEMRLSSKQAEHDSVEERLANSDMMVTQLTVVLFFQRLSLILCSSMLTCVPSWLLLSSMRIMIPQILTFLYHR